MTDLIVQSQLVASIPTTAILCIVIIVLCVISIRTFKDGINETGEKLDNLAKIDKQGFESVNKSIEKQIEQTKQYQSHILNLLNANHKELAEEMKETKEQVSETRKSLDNMLFRGTK